MLDAYSSLAMPLMYNHWSFGKLFAREETIYRGGYSALAYEIVINSNPCISYLLEENTMTMQALVIAHAAFGHNHFFKNNYLFQQWTECRRHSRLSRICQALYRRLRGPAWRDDVEAVLDSAHALMDQGVFRYRRPPEPSRERVLEKRRKRMEYEEEAYNELWRTLPAGVEPPARRPRSIRGRLRRRNEAAGRKYSLFPRKTFAGAEALAARSAAHRAQSLAIFLSAEADQGHERRLRHLRALHAHERALRKRPHHGELAAGIPAQPHERRVPAGIRRPALLRAQSLCAWLRHDGRHQAHCDEPDAEDRDWFPHIAGTGDGWKC